MFHPLLFCTLNKEHGLSGQNGGSNLAPNAFHTRTHSSPSSGSALPPGHRGTARDAPYLSLLAIRRNSRTVMAFFWMLYCVKSPDCPVTTCWMGAGITSSSMSS